MDQILRILFDHFDFLINKSKIDDRCIFCDKEWVLGFDKFIRIYDFSDYDCYLVDYSLINETQILLIVSKHWA